MRAMRSSFHKVLFALNCWFAVFSPCVAEEKDSPAERLAKVRKLADEQLDVRLKTFLSGDEFAEDWEYEACLTEAVRRGTQWEARLRAHYKTLMDRKFNLYGDGEELVAGSSFNLALLTALRRVQQKPDPLKVLLDQRPKQITTTTLALPRLNVAIENVDHEKQEVGFKFGGDYRSGRQARWRVVLKDNKGKTVPVRTNDSWIGGGIYHTGVLEPGESWKTELDLRDYLVAPKPGRYTLEVLYHNEQTILDEDDLAGLILCRSDPVPFILKPERIESSPDDREKVQKLLAKIPDDAKLKLVNGTYGKWAHEFIGPDSPQGQIMAMHLRAVPALIDSLKDPKRAKKKRAWILALLFSATGENDPRYPNALGEYDDVSGPWQVGGRTSNAGWSGGIGFASELSVTSSGISAENQQDLTKRWQAWRKAMIVEVEPRPDGDSNGLYSKPPMAPGAKK